MTADDNLLPLLTTEVVDKVLKLGVKDNTNLDAKQPITYQVTVRELTGLDVAGTGSQTATDVKTSSLRVRVRRDRIRDGQRQRRRSGHPDGRFRRLPRLRARQPDRDGEQRRERCRRDRRQGPAAGHHHR